MHLILLVEKGSIGEEMGLEKGDRLITINGENIRDVFDYRYLCHEEFLRLIVQKKDGEEWELEIEKEFDEELGLEFENRLMYEPKACKNKCIFCFIDQLPKNMRSTVYFKDDDLRLSFLTGNYVTLTNLKNSDGTNELDLVLQYRFSPINISVHTLDPDLRLFMLKNPEARKIKEYLDILNENDIQMNFQIVLCKGVNDGIYLEQSIEGLAAYMPNGNSLSVVPVGLSCHREGLHPLEPFTKEDAAALIEQVNKWQEHFLKTKNTRFVYAADEFYVKAGQAVPPYETYENFPQLENGVGMMALFGRQVKQALRKLRKKQESAASTLAAAPTPTPPQNPTTTTAQIPTPVPTNNTTINNTNNPPCLITIITGQAAYGFMQTIAKTIEEHFPGLHLSVLTVKNAFFGEEVTVSGLLTGRDILQSLAKEPLQSKLVHNDFVVNDLVANDLAHNNLACNDIAHSVLIPQNALKADEDLFLDDMTVQELENALKSKVYIVPVNGKDLVRLIQKIILKSHQ